MNYLLLSVYELLTAQYIYELLTAQYITVCAGVFVVCGGTHCNMLRISQMCVCLYISIVDTLRYYCRGAIEIS